jgi:regulatory protein
MPVITAIKSQKNKKRVNVHLDGKFGFGLDLDNFVKLNLKVEQELSEKEVAEIVKKAEFQKTLDKLLRFATLRPRSEKEINYWLKRKKVHESLQKGLFNKLKRLDLIDDRKFAEWWIGQRIQFKSKSKRELISELRIKGIDKNTIEDVLYETRIDEAKNAKKLIEKNQYKWERYDKRTARKKMGEYLARKGFAWEIIKKVIK